MKISQSYYNAFWRNPERYRLTYEAGVVPVQVPEELTLGLATHAVAEVLGANHPESTAWEVLSGRIGTPTGAFIRGLTSDQCTDALAWGKAAVGAVGGTVIGAEQDFEVPLSDGHTLAGRLDAVVHTSAALWVVDYKTTKETWDKIEREWRRQIQFRSVVLGARALGYPVVGIRVVAIRKVHPVQAKAFDWRYSDRELEAAKLEFADTADAIERLRARRPNGPWPHPAITWPCSTDTRCEYATVCGHEGAPVPDGVDWMRRELSPAERARAAQEAVNAQ